MFWKIQNENGSHNFFWINAINTLWILFNTKLTETTGFHLQITVNNIPWMQVLECWHNFCTIEACTVFCEHSFPWQMEEELKDTRAEWNKNICTFEKIRLSVHSKLLTPCDIRVSMGMSSHLATVGIFHYKTEPIMGLEGIFQCLQEENDHIRKKN